MLFVLSQFSQGLSKGCRGLSELLLEMAHERVSRGMTRKGEVILSATPSTSCDPSCCLTW